MYADEVVVPQEPVRLKWMIVSLKRILGLLVKECPIGPGNVEFEPGS